MEEQYEGTNRLPREALEESLAIRTVAGSEVDAAWTMKEIGLTATEQGELATATALVAKSLEICSRLGLTATTTDQIFAAALLASRTGKPEGGALPWMVARATVDEAPGWLRTRTKASFGFIAHNTRTYSEGDLIAGALVREITVLSPDRKPAEPCAEVLLLRQVSPATEATSDLAVAGENLRNPTGAVLRRPGIGQVLGIR